MNFNLKPIAETVQNLYATNDYDKMFVDSLA